MFKNRLDLKKVAAIAVCLAVTMFASCKKDDPNVEYVGVKLLDTETSGQFHSRKYMYDNKNRIKELRQKG